MQNILSILTDDLLIVTHWLYNIEFIVLWEEDKKLGLYY